MVWNRADGFSKEQRSTDGETRSSAKDGIPSPGTTLSLSCSSGHMSASCERRRRSLQFVGLTLLHRIDPQQCHAIQYPICFPLPTTSQFGTLFMPADCSYIPTISVVEAIRGFKGPRWDLALDITVQVTKDHSSPTLYHLLECIATPRHSASRMAEPAWTESEASEAIPGYIA